MKTVTYPLAMPEDLYGEVKRTAEKTRALAAHCAALPKPSPEE